jgi:hypothetical protein
MRAVQSLAYDAPIFVYLSNAIFCAAPHYFGAKPTRLITSSVTDALLLEIWHICPAAISEIQSCKQLLRQRLLPLIQHMTNSRSKAAVMHFPILQPEPGRLSNILLCKRHSRALRS